MTVEAFRSGIDLSYVDSDARPQDDLFGHVNGRWLAEYKIPADRATDGAFRSLYDRAEEQVRDLITGAATAATSGSGAATSSGTDEQRIGDLYASFMDEQTVAERGVQPLLDELATIDAAETPEALAAVVGALQRSGVGGGAGVYVDTDSKDSTRYLLHLNQSGLGLPDESYYRDEQHAEILAAYPTAHRCDVRPRVRRRSLRDGRAHRRAGNQAGRRALGRRQAPRRRPHLQPAHVRRPAGRGARIRLGGLGHRTGHDSGGGRGSRCAPT